MTAYRFTNLVLPVLGVMACTCDGIDRAGRLLVLGQDALKVGDCFVWVKAYGR